MTIKLEFKFERADDGTANLSVTLRAREFSGRGTAWTNISKMQSFVRALESYPLDSQALPKLSLGFWDSNGFRVEKEHIFIAAEPLGSLGVIRLDVRLAVPFDNSVEPRFAISAIILSDYAQLGEIGRGLTGLIEGDMRAVDFSFEQYKSN